MLLSSEGALTGSSPFPTHVENLSSLFPTGEVPVPGAPFITSTFVMMKPEVPALARTVLERVGSKHEGLELVLREVLRADHRPWIMGTGFTSILSEDAVARLYPDLVKRDFYPSFCRYMTSGLVRGGLVHGIGHNAAVSFRELLGATDPQKAEPGTLRRMLAPMDGVIMHNVMHASDSLTAAALEYAIFLTYK